MMCSVSAGKWKSDMNKTKLRTVWTLEEWLAGRARRRSMADAVDPRPGRRRKSSADRRLRRVFGGKRGPDFN